MKEAINDQVEWNYRENERQRNSQERTKRDIQRLEEERQQEQYRNWEREDLVKKIEDARKYGDEYGLDKAIRGLRRLEI